MKGTSHLRLVEPCGSCGSVQCDGSCIEPCSLCGASGCHWQCELEEPELDENAVEPVAAREREPSRRDDEEAEGESRSVIESITSPPHWYEEKPPPQPWLFVDGETNEGVLPKGEVCMGVAAGGVGKTMAAVQLAIAEATGLPWLNKWRPLKPGRVLLLLGEEKEEQARRRLYNAARLAGMRPPEGSIEIAPLSGKDCTLLERIRTPKLQIVQATRYYAQLHDHVRKRGPYDLIVLDPLSRFGGEEAETSNSFGTQLIECFEGLVDVGGATLLVMHHTSQWSRQQGNKEAFAARGTTSLTDGARWVVNMSIERNGDDGDLSKTELEETIEITNTKSNYGPRARPFKCRRDGRYGGALVPLSAADVETLKAAGENRKQRKQDEKEAARAAKEKEKCDLEDAALDEILSQPDPPQGRALRDAMRDALDGCSSDRVAAAVRRRAARAARAAGTDGTESAGGTDGTSRAVPEAQGVIGGPARHGSNGTRTRKAVAQ